VIPPALRLAALLSLVAPAAIAAPDLTRVVEAGPLQVYRDHEREDLFYYAPGELQIATDRGGRPELRFLQLRYVGTALYGNEGETGSLSTLSLRVRMNGPDASQLGAVRRGIRRALGRDRIEIRPLPITRFEAGLVYVPVGDPDAAPSALPAGHFEAADERESRTGREGFWSERTYTVPLNEKTSQLFWRALHEGELAMSVAYVFWTTGVGLDDQVFVSIRRESSNAMEMLLDRLGLSEPDALDEMAHRLEEEARQELSSKMVRSGAFAVRVNAERWPDLFQRIDFNDAAPPGYATLRVYCYDFQNAIRDDLFYKKIEVVAEAVGGREVSLEAKFLSSQPDLYARTLRFPVAVHVDRPYRYRVVAAHRDGHIEKGEWIERASWSRILDVTTQAVAAEGDAA